MSFDSFPILNELDGIPLQSTADETLSFFFENDLPFTHTTSPSSPLSTNDNLLLFPPSVLEEPLPLLQDDSPLFLNFPEDVVPFFPPVVAPPVVAPPESLLSSSPPEPVRATYLPISPKLVDDQPAKKRGRPEQPVALKKELNSPTSDDCTFHFHPVDALAELGNGVTLPRTTLLKISSEEFEVFVSHLVKLRHLSETEYAEIKRQRRLIRNREYASLSRTKRKKESLTATQQVDKLEKENYALRTENSHLKQEIMRLRTVINEQKYLSSESASSPPPLTQVPTTPSHWNPLVVGHRPLKTTAILFIIFFSFTFFQSAPFNDSPSSFIHQTSNRVLLDLSSSTARFSDPITNYICTLPYISTFRMCSSSTTIPPEDVTFQNISFEPCFP